MKTVKRTTALTTVTALAFLGLVCLLFNNSVHADVPHGISISLVVPQANLASRDDVLLEVIYQNTTAAPIKMLKRGTALEGGIFHDFLIVEFDGQRINYSGWHAKRMPPIEADYVTFLPGELKSSIIDVVSGYALSAQGVYDIQYNIAHPFNASASTKYQSSSSSVSIRLTEERAVSLLKRPARNINNSCSANEFSTADAALSVAERIALAASRDMDDAPIDKRPSARRYTEWFGVYESGRYGQVASGMKAVALAAANQVVGFDCDCRSVFGDDARGIFAAVNPNDPYNILLCDVFWRVSQSGTDSQSGTIVHELSHFNILAGTDDFDSALDQSGSRQLADRSPGSAIRNANAFEYFAENTPFLSMPSSSGDDDDVDDDDGNGSDDAVDDRKLNAVIAAILSILLGD